MSLHRRSSPLVPGSRAGQRRVEATIDVLYRRRWIIASCVLVALIVSAAFAFLRPQAFEARAVVLVDLTRVPDGQPTEMIGDTPVGGSERSLTTELFILQHNYAISQRVAERLRETKGFKARGTVGFEPTSRAVNSAFYVVATSPTPEEATLLANTYAAEYIAQTQHTSRLYLAAARAFLEEQEARHDARLRAAEHALQRHRQRAGSAALSPEGTALVDRVAGMEIARDEAMIDLQMRQAQITLLEREIEQIDGSSDAADLKRRSIQERIALEGLEARVASMNQRLGQYRRELRSMPELATVLGRLERDRLLAERTYAHVIERLQDTRIQEENEPGYARMLHQATPPESPVGRSPWNYMGIGLLLGLVGGLALAAAWDRLDTRVYKPDQLREVGLGVLGVVPNFARHVRETHRGAATIDRGGTTISTSLVTLTDPQAAPAETFRHMRTALQMTNSGSPVKTILVTSSSKGDGKTTVASNLAVALAQSDQRTLLIDADLRRPRVHRLFGAANAYGLAQLLLSTKDLRQLGPDCGMDRFRSAQHPHLFVLPSGMFYRNDSEKSPGEMLGSKRMREVLGAFGEHFDAIVIDTPPVLVATDAVMLSTYSDAVVVVARAAASKGGDLGQALDLLSDVGAPLAGIVLNGFDLSLAYGYRYTYGHYTQDGPYSQYGGDSGPYRSKGVAA
jgi:polysaccharide biosynthesis transport protein